MSRRWYNDEYGFMKLPIVVAGFIALIALLFAGCLAGALWTSSLACEQKAKSRPDIPVEWHWTTGCIQLHPDTTVVISG